MNPQVGAIPQSASPQNPTGGTMKSGNQRRSELSAKRTVKRTTAAADAKQAALARAEARRLADGGIPVNFRALAPTGSYDRPDFVMRGYYVAKPFVCKDCGKHEVWTAGQQRWWYEIAKGDMWTTATRCRPCRRHEREKRAEARRTHLEAQGRKTGSRQK